MYGAKLLWDMHETRVGLKKFLIIFRNYEEIKNFDLTIS